MKCPICESEKTKVVDKRLKEAFKNKRRRECEECLTRFNTIETIQINSIEKILLEKGKVARRKLVRNHSGKCSVDGCGDYVEANGLCLKHYAKSRRENPTRFCEIEGCQKAHYGRGYCSTHWRRWKIYGDPHFKKTTGKKALEGK